MTSRLIPQGNRILVEDIRETMTEGGLHIPDRANDRRKVVQGRIVAVGTGVPHAPDAQRSGNPGYHVGQVVLFMAGAGVEVVYRGTTYLTVKGDEVLCVEGPSPFDVLNPEMLLQCGWQGCEATARARVADRAGWSEQVAPDGIFTYRCRAHGGLAAADTVDEGEPEAQAIDPETLA